MKFHAFALLSDCVDVEHTSAPQAGYAHAVSLPEVRYEGFEPSPYEQESLTDEYAPPVRDYR